jgi:HEAT repeat protein
MKLAEMEPVLARVAAWDYSQPHDPLTEFSAFLREAIRARSELPQVEARLLRMLAPGAGTTAAARDYVCRELSVIGTTASLPALRLLKDSASAEIARYALARISPPKPVEVPRTATPSMLRIAALGKAPLPALAKELSSPDPDIQAAAILLLNRIPGADVTAIFLKQYPSLSPMGQYRVLHALAGRGDPSARPLALSALKSPVPELREAALFALGRIGDASSVSALAEAAANAPAPEQAAARESLYTLHAEGVDSAIASAIASSAGKARLELIRAAGDRASPEAADVLMKTAQGSDAEASLAAIRALRNAAGPEHAPALLDAVVRIANATQRREAAMTLASVIRRAPKPDIGPVMAACQSAGDKPVKLTLLDVLGQVSAGEALPLLRAGLKDPDPEIARAAILALTAWQNPAPLPDLLALARTQSNATLQVLALRGYIKVAAVPSDRSPAETVALLEQVWPLARLQAEKRSILAVLPLFPTPEALRMAEAAVADPAVSREAKAAVESIRGLR